MEEKEKRYHLMLIVILAADMVITALGLLANLFGIKLK